jgi:hypothetical protein
MTWSYIKPSPPRSAFMGIAAADIDSKRRC